MEFSSRRFLREHLGQTSSCTLEEPEDRNLLTPHQGLPSLMLPLKLPERTVLV